MRQWLLVPAAAVLLVTGLSACGDDADSTTSADGTTTTVGLADAPDATDAPEGDLELTQADDGSTHTIAVGDTVTIRFVVAGGTGYSWKLTEQQDEGVIRVVPESELPADTTTTMATGPDGSPEIMTGRPETTRIVVEGVAPGEVTIRLGLYSPTGDEPEETMTVHLVVV